jgi:hypothetical protein
MLKINFKSKLPLILVAAVLVLPVSAIAATQPGAIGDLTSLLLGDNAGLGESEISPLAKLGQKLISGSSVGVQNVATGLGIKIYREDGGLDVGSILGDQNFDSGLLKLATELTTSDQPFSLATLRTIAANNAIAGSATANSKAAERVAVSTKTVIDQNAEVYKSAEANDPESSLEALGEIKRINIGNSRTIGKLAQSNLLNAKTSDLILSQSMQSANEKRIEQILTEVDSSTADYQLRLAEYHRNARYTPEGDK